MALKTVPILVVGTVFSYPLDKPLIGEQMTWRTVVGGTLILAGLWIVSRR